MTDGFEAWTRSEVRRLRDEADQLERMLAKYTEAVSGATGGRSGGAAHPMPPRTAPRAPISDLTRAAPAAGKNAPLMQALEAAGSGGLSVDEVHEAAKQHGLKSGRGAIRSYLWNQKHAGRVVAIDAGRYALASHVQADGAGSTDAPSPSSTEEPGTGQPM